MSENVSVTRNEVIAWDDGDLDGPLTARFDKVVDTVGRSTALIDRQRSWTFDEVKNLSLRIAACIRTSHAAPRKPIALLFGPSVYRIAGIIGVLRTGRPFVPLDISYPTERNRMILEESGAELVLTDRDAVSAARSAAEARRRVVNLDHIPQHSEHDPAPQRLSGHELCAIIYTSGSSGRPRGVMHSHRSVLWEAMTTSVTLGLVTRDRFVQVSPTGSVASLSQTMSAALSGAAGVPCSLLMQGLGAMSELMQRHGITVYSSAPAIFRLVANACAEERAFEKLRIVRLGGEEVRVSDWALCRSRCGGSTTLQVAYGSTETGINAVKVLSSSSPPAPNCVSLPVGVAVEGKELRILDDRARPSPPGNAGELFVAGPGLASGYWGCPELTNERFVELDSPAGGRRRFFRTGDLVRQNQAGELVFVGRSDRQVKVHGFRTELGDVEAAILSHPAVRECAVEVHRPGRGEELVAYVTLCEDAAAAGDDLCGFVRQKLPLHMVPGRFVVLAALPVGPNGKIDRGALHGSHPSEAVVTGRDDPERCLRAVGS